MDSIRIDSGIKRIAVNGDPERVIVFNPTDITFAERFYALFHDFEAKQGEYQQRAEAIDQVQETDANGLPVNLADRIAFMREVCEYVHRQIDELFGAGTSLKAFEGVLDLEMIGQFFKGITPFVAHARSEQLAKYRRPKTKRRVMKK